MSYTILPDPQMINLMIDVAKLSSMQTLIEMNLINSDNGSMVPESLSGGMKKV